MPIRLEEELIGSLRVGFIDSANQSDYRYVPKLLVNDVAQHTNVLSSLKTQLAKCERFDFSVAFITASGIETIIQLLLEMRERNIPGRILTTTLNNFNEPEALRKLLEFPNIEVRVFEGALHTKGYFFKQNQINAVIIGSANLTQNALCSNKEWNLLLHLYEDGELFQSARREYELLWQASQTAVLTEEWIAAYEAYRATGETGVRGKRLRPFTSARGDEAVRLTAADSPEKQGRVYRHVPLPPVGIRPNTMQKAALASLDKLHREGASRALLISATGTGKTYLSAFDVLATQPKKVLFVAHRKRILDASRKSFERVLGNAYRYGMLAGSTYQPAECLFAMVGTLVNRLDSFDPLEFDYLIIDETHRAGAEGYRKVLSHFAPKFTLGMTATPQRTDGYDIFALYNHVIAYRITLQDALREDMLAPFHYYGIADMQIDGEDQDDATLFNRLTSTDRVDHILKKLDDYSVSKVARKGLVFCSRINEAQALSDEFNRRGYRTQALSGADSEAVRDRAIERLEEGELQYLFSGDIFNEGVDIPAVNQIVMLRPTESAIVFVQQLGRGLRKAEGKESVLVLDFIGNYQSNYLIPIALSGDRTYDKDNLRRFVKEGSSIIPGNSTVSFDRVSESRIFEKIDSARFSETRLIRAEYEKLSMMLGRVPTLADFDEQGMIDPLLIFDKFGSYHAFLSKYEKRYSVQFDEAKGQVLRYLSKKLASGKRADELVALRMVIEGESCPFELLPSYGSGDGEQLVRSVASVLGNGFALARQRESFRDCVFVEPFDNGFEITEKFRAMLHDREFRRQVLEVLDFGIARSEKNFSERYADTNFVLYEKYTMEDACRLLNWSQNANPQNVGGYQYNRETNTFPVFINYNKEPDISDTIRYEDRFVSDREIIAISKQPRTLASPEIVRLKAWPANGMKTYLFVRKNKNDADGGKEFYFLGMMYPTHEYRQFKMPNTGGKTAVEITYRLDVPVRADVYDYLTSAID